MNNNSIAESVKSYGLKKVITYLDSDPDKNIPKILDWAEKFDKDGVARNQLKAFQEALSDEKSNWYQLAKSLWTDIDENVRKKTFENFIVNATIIGGQRQAKSRIENNCNVPWAILMDPTSACNLHCTGCWAADYGNKMNMSFETLNSIIEQGKALGTYMYIFSGGEPLVRKEDVIRLCEEAQRLSIFSFHKCNLDRRELCRGYVKNKKLYSSNKCRRI